MMELSLQTFAPHKDSVFTVQTQGGDVELILCAVEESPRGARPQRFRTPLFLTFTGPDHIALLQDNYRFSHPVLGEHVWCMAPSAGPTPGLNEQVAREYQVIFN